MPILELFPKPARGTDQSSDQSADLNTTGVPPPPRHGEPAPVAKALELDEIEAPAQPAPRSRHRTGPRISLSSNGASAGTARYSSLEQHELIHLIDSLDDERARARFRESVYISVIVWLAIGWFLFYGPRVLFHLPQYRDPIAALKEHDQQITLNMPKAPPVPRVAPKIDPKTMEALKKQAELERQAHPAPPTPQPPTQQPAPQPPTQEMAHNTAPPMSQPPLPLPSAPKPAPSPLPDLPSAPKPNTTASSESPRDAINSMRSMMGTRGGGINAPSSSRPVQAGVEVLSDTQGVDFSAYLRKLHYDIQKNWEPLIPEEVQAPLLKKGIVGIRFTILPNGDIGGMILETRSGDVALDHAAWSAITSEGQFPPLPKQFHGPNLELRCGFFYNEPLDQ